MLERVFQARLIKTIKRDLPGSIVLKTDPNYIQGFPDLIVLHGDKWAALEVKKDPTASHQPNQDYYVDVLNRMSFARFINPTNEKEIRHELYKTLGPGRNARVSESEQQCLDQL